MNKKGWRRLILVGLVSGLIVQGACIPGPTMGQASARETAGQCVNVSAGRDVGIGVSFLHGDIGVCAKLWPTDRTAVSACLLAASGGGEPRTAAKVQETLIDTCYLDGYLALGAEIPVSHDISWQRFDVALGLELSLPDISEFAFCVEAGVSVGHYSAWWGWYWRSESYVAVEVDLYF